MAGGATGIQKHMGEFIGSTRFNKQLKNDKTGFRLNTCRNNGGLILLIDYWAGGHLFK